MPKDWLNLSEAAKVLGVHPSTVRNWADQGRLPVYRTQGKHRRFKRDEVELWLQSQQASAPNEASLVVQNALKQTRFRISEGRLEAEPWYQKLDLDARSQYRESGRILLQGLMNYMASNDDEADAEARSLGYEYATRGRRYGLNVSDATQAFLFFRNALIDAMLGVYESAAVRSPVVVSGMFRKINAFTDRILITLMETYAAFNRNTK
jgi:excisionase family DNA binding protein